MFGQLYLNNIYLSSRLKTDSKGLNWTHQKSGGIEHMFKILPKRLSKLN